MRQCPSWQFVLIWAAAMGLGCVAGGLIGQLGRHHLDWGELLAMAAGGAVGASIFAILFRQNQQRS